MSVNKNGFTLVEVMIAVGLSTMLTAGAAGFLTYANSQRLTLEAQSNAQQLARDIALVTSSPASCMTAMQSLVMPTGAIKEVDFNIGLRNTSVGTGTILPNDHLKINRLWLAHLNTIATPGPNGLPLTLADVMLDAQANTPTGIRLRPRPVARVYMELAGGALKSCTSNRKLPNVLKLTCAQMGGVFVDASSSCDMTPYVNGIIADARNQIDIQLYGPYQSQVMAQVNTDVVVMMTNAKNSALATAGTYTSSSMAAVNGNLVNNANGLNNSIANLNNLIQSNVASLTAGLNNTTNQANAVYQLAQDAYNNAIASYQNSMNSYNQANAANSYASTAGNAAQSANQNAQGARNTAYYMTSVAWNAMNQATNSANGASAANQYAASAAGAASAAINNANGAVGYASSAYGQANAAYNYIPGVRNWVNQVSGVVNSAMNAANQAASNASYAAGVSNQAATNAQYALSHIPTQTNNYINQVTFVPGARPASYHWGPGQGAGGICPGDAVGGGSCNSPGLQCWIFTPFYTMNVLCQ